MHEGGREGEREGQWGLKNFSSVETSCFSRGYDQETTTGNAKFTSEEEEGGREGGREGRRDGRLEGGREFYGGKLKILCRCG